MHYVHRYISSLYLAAALLAPVATLAAPSRKRPTLKPVSTIGITRTTTIGMTAKTKLGGHTNPTIT